MRRLLLAAVLLAATRPAWADTRVVQVGSFDRIRVEGPFDVRLTTSVSPAAVVEGDEAALDTVQVQTNGDMLVVRPGTGGWGERPSAGRAPTAIVRIATGTIRSATVVGGGSLRIDGPVRGQRIDLALTGSGALAAPGLDADELSATLLGSGSMALGGRAGRARLITSGSGTIAATPLAVDALTVRLDGPGATEASARYTADLTGTGVGAITVGGHPACTVHPGGGPVQCGD